MNEKIKIIERHSGGSAVYGLGVIGALFYFLPGAVTLNAILIGIIKSIFWPAFVIYYLLGFLNVSKTVLLG